MTSATRPFLRTLPLILACFVVLAGATPALALDPNSNSILDWKHAWCIWRVGLWLVLALAAGGLAFWVLFPAQLQPEKRQAPWPRTAFGRCLALWWLVAGLCFFVLFGLISEELHRDDRMLAPNLIGNFINHHWPSILVLAVTAGGAAIIAWRVKHHESTAY